jgi:hypothetical protein
MSKYRTNFNYKIGDELYFCNRDDSESYLIHKIVIDHLHVSLPCGEDDGKNPNHYSIKLLTPSIKENKNSGGLSEYEFVRESELFETQEEALEYCYDQLLKQEELEEEEYKAKHR